MAKNKELWHYEAEEKVWVGKYLNSQNISHWHNDYELVHLNEGCLDIIVDGETYELRVGDSLLIESQKIHSMHAQVENTIATIIIFDSSIIKKMALAWQLESPLLENDYKISELYEELLYELTAKPLFYELNTVNSIQKLVINILRNERIVKPKKNKKMSDNFLKLIEEINTSYRYFTFNNAVEIMNMNSSYFSRFFHNMTGISFAKYLNCIKVEKAVELIHENHTIPMTEIADLCGFQTIRNFNRIFKSFTGYSPKNIPSDYIFNGLQDYQSNDTKNPTLNNCKLIEYSSPHN